MRGLDSNNFQNTHSREVMTAEARKKLHSLCRRKRAGGSA